jgi:hypothetical protein
MKVSLIVIIVVLLVGTIAFFAMRPARVSIFSYAECVAAGNPIVETDPPQCKTPDGKTFVGFMQNATPTLHPETPTIVITPTVSESEANIMVSLPKSNQTVVTEGGFILKGRARVFENVLQYRLVTDTGVIVTQGTLNANSPDVGQYGDFEKNITTKIKDTDYNAKGAMEVFSYSAKDGSEINKVVVPILFLKPAGQ